MSNRSYFWSKWLDDLTFLYAWAITRPAPEPPADPEYNFGFTDEQLEQYADADINVSDPMDDPDNVAYYDNPFDGYDPDDIFDDTCDQFDICDEAFL